MTKTVFSFFLVQALAGKGVVVLFYADAAEPGSTELRTTEA